MKRAYGKEDFMIKNKSISERVFDSLNSVVMVLLMVICLYPLLYVAFASISEGTQLIKHSGLLLKPLGLNLSSYKMVFENPMIIQGYANTLVVVFGGLIVNLLMTSLGAYFLSRKGMYWKKHITLFIVFTMFFGGGLIPFYLIIKGLSLNDTLWSVIIPYAINTYNLIIMRTAFEAIPESLEEAAKIDGANDFHILFKIVIPLSMPVIAVMILYYGVSHWNSWFPAMMFIRKRELYPLQLILREILIENNTDSMMSGGAVNVEDYLTATLTIKYATTMIATVPILCIYPFLQKYFAKGVMIGAVKG